MGYAAMVFFQVGVAIPVQIQHQRDHEPTFNSFIKGSVGDYVEIFLQIDVAVLVVIADPAGNSTPNCRMLSKTGFGCGGGAVGSDAAGVRIRHDFRLVSIPS